MALLVWPEDVVAPGELSGGVERGSVDALPRHVSQPWFLAKCVEKRTPRADEGAGAGVGARYDDEEEEER